jgi:hypothetical protein
MFATLDSIDWSSFGYHIYRRHEQIPVSIRALLSQDEGIRREALGFLLGEGQDFGSIYDTTPHIIPFCLEVLANGDSPGKADLIMHLSGQAGDITVSGTQSVRMMDLCLRTYNALRTGLDIYHDILIHGNRDERSATCELLKCMTGDAARTIPALLAQVDHEDDEEVRVYLLYAVKNLLAALDWTQLDIRDQSAPDLRRIVERHPSTSTRIAAARASVELVKKSIIGGDKLISPQVPEQLFWAFLLPGEPLYWSDDIPSLYQKVLVEDMSCLDDPSPLHRLLAEPGITPEQALLLAKGLLCQAQVSRSRQAHFWKNEGIYK